MKKNVFIAVFVLAILLPNIIYYGFYGCFDTENHEKRAYAELPAFSVSNIDNIPSGLEAFYMDRVPFKNEIKAMTSRVDIELGRYRSMYEIFSGGFSGVTIGVDRWMYYTVSTRGEDSIQEMFGRNLYTEEELKETGEKLEAVDDFFEERGTAFVSFIVPNKEQVYDEYLPETYRRHVTDYTRARQLADYVRRHTDAVMVYPLDYLRACKENRQLYYKYDTHWNRAGAIAGIQPVLEAVGAETDDVAGIEFEEKTPCIFVDLAMMLGLQDSCMDDIEYVPVNFRPEVEIVQGESVIDKDTRLGIAFRYDSNAPDPREVLYIGDSFRLVLATARVLPRHFAHVSIIDRASDEVIVEYFKTHHPDIVIYETCERFVTAPGFAYTELVELLKDNTEYGSKWE